MPLPCLRARGKYFTAALLLVCALTLTGRLQAESNLELTVSQDSFDFGTLDPKSAEMEHTFYFRNTTSETLEIRNVGLTQPLSLKTASRSVLPGETGYLTVEIPSPRKKGAFQGRVEVDFRDQPQTGLVFQVRGAFYPPIELRPGPSLSFTTTRGEPTRQPVDIINHEAAPLQIKGVEVVSPSLKTEIETLEEGRLYRLWVTFNGGGPPSEASQTITLITSSSKQPLVDIKVRMSVEELIHAWPPAVDFGVISTRASKAYVSKRLLLTGAVDALPARDDRPEITAYTDVPFLRLSLARSLAGSRHEIEVSVIPERLEPGPVNGSIVVFSDKVGFPKLVVPVKGRVESAFGEEIQ